MKKYKKIVFRTDTITESEILMAQLDEEGFYAFESSENKLMAYIEEDLFDESKLKELLNERHPFNVETIEEENWNTQWESSFSPVIVEDFVAIRAGFHPPVTQVKHEIIVTPKMSFGTGHHATTYLMLESMQAIDFRNKRVIDFGTGTGVLAILASRLGANTVTGIDNDDWSIDNAKENLQNNDCNHVSILKAENLEGTPQSDIIYANINKNILLDNADSLSDHLVSGGVLFLSGILSSDRNEMVEKFGSLRLGLLSEKIKNGWLMLQFVKS